MTSYYIKIWSILTCCSQIELKSIVYWTPTSALKKLIYLIICNINYYRCNFENQYCCGYICCHKLSNREDLLGSWYFWSLMSLVLIVFGCIICSFTINSFAKKQTTIYRAPSAWMGLLSGSVDLSHLSSTIGGHGRWHRWV